MNPLDELVQFCRAHGTPKLRRARTAPLRAFLRECWDKQCLVQVTEGSRTVGLGIGWPRPDDATTLYVANLCAVDGEALRRIMQAARQRWPQVQRFTAHRVPKARRATSNEQGQPAEYTPRQWSLLWRLAGKQSVQSA